MQFSKRLIRFGVASRLGRVAARLAARPGPPWLARCGFDWQFGCSWHLCWLDLAALVAPGRLDLAACFLTRPGWLDLVALGALARVASWLRFI